MFGPNFFPIKVNFAPEKGSTQGMSPLPPSYTAESTEYLNAGNVSNPV